MAPWLIPIGGFLKAHWKGLTIAGISIMLLLGSYWKGQRDCAIRHELATQKELQKRFEEESKERDRLILEKERLERLRKEQSKSDKLDTCILSNDPFEIKCEN